jgi:hypothetical protein
VRDIKQELIKFSARHDVLAEHAKLGAKGEYDLTAFHAELELVHALDVALLAKLNPNDRELYDLVHKAIETTRRHIRKFAATPEFRLEAKSKDLDKRAAKAAAQLSAIIDPKQEHTDKGLAHLLKRADELTKNHPLHADMEHMDALEAEFTQLCATLDFQGDSARWFAALENLRAGYIALLPRVRVLEPLFEDSLRAHIHDLDELATTMRELLQ